jgi:hypothetical protein
MKIRRQIPIFLLIILPPFLLILNIFFQGMLILKHKGADIVRAPMSYI